MSKHTRRVFLGAAAAASLSAPVAGREDESEKAAGGQTTDADPVKARPSIWIEDYPLSVSGYPNPEGTVESGEVSLYTYGEEVVLNVSMDDEHRHFESALEFTPEQADKVAALLQEFAAKARNGEGWVYP